MSSALRKIKVRAKHKRKASGKKKVSLSIILSKKEKKVRLYLLAGGFLLVFLAFYTSPKDTKVPLTLNTANGDTLSASFANEPVKIDAQFLEPTPRGRTVKNPPVRLVISSLNIDIPVKESRIINGFWEVFPDSAGFGMGSAYPQDSGNQVIFAHARKGLFEPLKEIKTGANVIVMTSDKWYSYTVTEVREVLPSQTEVIAPSSDPVLTLYTCTGYADSKRLIVKAVRNPQ